MKQETARPPPRGAMAALARALGLSRGQITKLAARGMPVDDVDGARAWRRRHLDPSWAKPDPGPLGASGSGEGDPVGKALRLMCADVCNPEFVSIAIAAAGLELDGEETLRMAEGLAEAYMALADTILGGAGQYPVPDELLTRPGTPARAAVVERIDTFRRTRLAALPAGDKGNGG